MDPFNIVSIILGSLSLAAGITEAGLSGAQGAAVSDEEEKKRKMLEDKQREDESEFNKEYYKDIRERADVQALLSEYEEQAATEEGKRRANEIYNGATDDYRLASQSAANEKEADFMSNLALQAQAYKQDLAKEKRARRDDWYGQLGDTYDYAAQARMMASTNLANAASNSIKTGIESLVDIDWQTGNKSKKNNDRRSSVGSAQWQRRADPHFEG